MGAPEETQALLTNPNVSASAAVSDPKKDAQRSWRFPLWRIVGDGSPEDVVAGCMAWNLPLVAFGWNMHRSLQVCFWREVIKVLAVLGGSYLLLSLSAHALVYSCAGWPKPPAHGMKPMGKQGMGAEGMDTSMSTQGAMGDDDKDPHHHGCGHLFGMVKDLPDECRATVVGGLSVILVVAVIVVVAVVVYAAKRRQQIREQFGIAGTFQKDLLSWMFCSVCALAQETRTLMVNQVHEGVWYGPMVNNANCAPATQQMV